MGMFDYVVSDYKIFGGRADRDLQTKSFDSCLETYYIDPAGQVYHIDYSKTYRIESCEQIPFIREIPTGNNGRVIPLRNYSGLVRLSGSTPNGSYCSAVLLVEQGKVKHTISCYD